MEAMKDTSIDPILNPKNKSYVKNDIFLHFAVYIHCGWYDKGTFCHFFYLGPLRDFSPEISCRGTAGGKDWTIY